MAATCPNCQNAGTQLAKSEFCWRRTCTYCRSSRTSSSTSTPARQVTSRRYFCSTTDSSYPTVTTSSYLGLTVKEVVEKYDHNK